MQAEVKTQSNATIKGLLQLTRGFRVTYLVAVLLSTTATILMLGVPLVGKHALNVLVEQDFAFADTTLLSISDWIGISQTYLPYLVVSAVAGVLLTLASTSCQFGRDRLSAVASESIALKLREVLFDRLHHVSMSFYDDKETGDLVQRCSSDIETVRVFMHADVDEAGRAVLFILGMIPILFWHHATLSWFAFLLIPVLFFGGFFFFWSITKLFQVTDESEGALTSVLQENLTGIRVVRAFARQEFEQERFAVKNAAFRDNYFKLNKVMALYWAGADVLAMSQIGIVLFVGAYFYLQGSINIGELFLFMMYVSSVVWRIRHAGRILADGGKAVVALRRINFILNESPEEVQATPENARLKGNIEFRNASLRFTQDKPVLKSVSVHISAGETIGIVGAPGSGKSLLIRTLLRIHELSAGTILVDDQDISKIDRKWLRRNIGVVLQEPFLFSRSVKDNLLVGRANASDRQLVKASEEAAVHEAIQSFDKGYDSLIGERGVTLSGGQRQRLALARALLKDPPILVLDDALSAVDTGTEEQILQKLDARRGRHTTIIVAHRLSTLRSVDRILVFVHGELTQVGTHEQLANRPGPYFELCQLQSLMDQSIKIEASAHV